MWSGLALCVWLHLPVGVNATAFSALPSDVLEQILHRLSPADLVSFFSTSKAVFARRDEDATQRDFRRLFSRVYDPDFPALIDEMQSRLGRDAEVRDLFLRMSETQFVFLFDTTKSVDRAAFLYSLFTTGISEFDRAFRKKFGSLFEGLQGDLAGIEVPVDAITEKLERFLNDIPSESVDGDASPHNPHIEQGTDSFHLNFFYRRLLRVQDDTLARLNSLDPSLLSRPTVLLELLKCGKRFKLNDYLEFVKPSEDALDTLFPLLRISFEGPSETLKTRSNWELLRVIWLLSVSSDMVARLPCVLTYFGSLDADSFKCIETSQRNLAILSNQKEPLLSTILGTREREGEETLLSWIRRRQHPKVLQKLSFAIG
jgi:hypothetical protein